MQNQDLLNKLWSRTKIDPVSNCWLFEGTNQRGHGQLRYMGRSHGVHRLSAFIHLGMDLNDSKIQANHKRECPNRNCWNPEHLYIGNQSENIKDAVASGTYHNQNNTKIYCKNGHPLFGPDANVSIRADGIRCKTCKKEYDRLRNESKMTP